MPAQPDVSASADANKQFVLGKNQYGKAGNHVVRITRDTARHEIEDLTVISQLHGDFETCHTEGDNSQCVATDTQDRKSTRLNSSHIQKSRMPSSA